MAEDMNEERGIRRERKIESEMKRKGNGGRE